MQRSSLLHMFWGDEFVQFLAALAVLPRTILKNRMNSSFYFKSSWCNSSYYSVSSQAKRLAHQGIEYIFPPNRSNDRCLFFCINPSSMVSTDLQGQPLALDPPEIHEVDLHPAQGGVLAHRVLVKHLNPATNSTNILNIF